MEINQLHLNGQYFQGLNRAERNVPKVVHMSEEEKEQWRRKWLSLSGWRARPAVIERSDRRTNDQSFPSTRAKANVCFDLCHYSMPSSLWTHQKRRRFRFLLYYKWTLNMVMAFSHVRTKAISKLILAIKYQPNCTALNLQWKLRTVIFPPLTVLSSIYCKQSTALVFLSLSGSVNKSLRLIYTERKWTRKRMYLSNLCLRSI